MGRALGGPRVGFLAALFLAAVPSYYGHMFLNSKDIPFAAAAVWALYYTVLLLRTLPRVSLSLTLMRKRASPLAAARMPERHWRNPPRTRVATKTAAPRP